MRPKHLTISGWGPYKEVNSIDFTRLDGHGIFLITGPTGAGKTTIFDAICFALYGVMSGEIREKNSVRSDFCDADTKTYVELVMEHAGKEYRIYRNPEYARQKKRKGGKQDFTIERENGILYLQGGSVIEGSQEVTRRIQEILVLDYKQFKQISMLAQGEFAKLLTASGKEKMTIFREIFGTGILDKFSSLLNAKSKKLYGQVMEIRHKLEENIRLIQTQDEKLQEEIADKNPNYERIIKELEALEKEEKERLASVNEQQDKLEKELQELFSMRALKLEENQQLERLLYEKEKLVEIEAQGQKYQQLESELIPAKKALALEPLQKELSYASQTLKKCQEEEQLLQEELLEWKKEWEQKKPVYEKKESILEFLEKKEQLQKTLEELESLKKSINGIEEEMELLQKDYLKLEQLRDESRKLYEDEDRKYKRAAVGIAARMVKEGEPCPVCGSLEHPLVAVSQDTIPDEKELEGLQKKYKKREEELVQLFGKITGLQGQMENEKKNLDNLEEKRNGILQTLENKRGEAELFSFVQSEAAKKRLEEITTRCVWLLAMIPEREQQLEKNRGEMKKLLEEENKSRKKFSNAILEQGFESMEQYQNSMLSVAKIEEMEKKLREYQDKLLAVGELISHLEKNKKIEKPHDMTEVEEQLLKKQDEKAAGQKLIREMQVNLLEWKKYRKAIQEKIKKLDKLEEEYGVIKDLAQTSLGVNPKRVMFEQYVLASYFEEILEAANLRFSKMTGGRFEMSRVEEVSDKRTKDSLEIQVLDFYTGKYRSVKTLSGGETFKCSLALALGMSDVIQGFHGGIRVDTLFIDEGFGALDEESLDQACDALISMAGKDRLIGIISHVAELKEKINSQIEIEKTNSGSKMKIMI